MKTFICSISLFLITNYSSDAQSCWKFFASHYTHTLAINRDGTLWGCGRNEASQLGDSTQIDRNKFVQIGRMNDWLVVSAGTDHSLGIKLDGSLWAWGSNYNGQLGDSVILDKRKTPLRIGTANDWRTISAGGAFSLAIKTDGTLWAWGGNWGQLGNGSLSGNRIKPTIISNTNDWSNVVAGITHSMAIKVDGSLWGWGNNNNGQLGDSTRDPKYVPTRIGNGNNWLTISVGGKHSVGVKTDGTLWVWGANDSGQLGDSTFVGKTIQTQIGKSNSWRMATAGNEYTLAIDKDGKLWGSGTNDWGQLGDSSIIYRTNRLTLIRTVNQLQNIVTSRDYSIAMKTDSTFWAWGSDFFGQLGKGENRVTSKPSQLPCYRTPIEELTIAKFSIYPNPVSHEITISLIDTEENIQKIKIIDLVGKIVLEKTLNEKKATLNVADFPKGLYIISVETVNKKKGIQRIVRN